MLDSVEMPMAEMYDIHMAEVTEEFARCWNDAGLHLQHLGQDSLRSWLRAHLTPPFLEHLSFRLGNQLFFIRIVDIAGKLDTPGNADGLLAIADGCAGHACLMPMKHRGQAWIPVAPGWGLIDARSGRLIDPPALVSDQLIEMTAWELQDLAVQVVRDHLRAKNMRLMSWNGDPRVDPSLWFVGESGGPEWVVVRPARYPVTVALVPDNLPRLKHRFAATGYPGHFASVACAHPDDVAQPRLEDAGHVRPLYRGHGIHCSFEGLTPI